MTAALGLALALSIFLGVPFIAITAESSRYSGGLSPAAAAMAGPSGHDGSAVRASGEDGVTHLGNQASPIGGTPVRLSDVPAQNQRTQAVMGPPARTNSHQDAPARTIQVARRSPLTVERDAQDVELAIVEAAREYNVDAALLLCIAHAESNLDMEAAGADSEVGAFQFRARTWKANAKLLGYRLVDIVDPIAQARVAAEMLSRGQGYQWTTYRGCVR